MSPQGDMHMAKTLQAEFSKKGLSSNRPTRPGRARKVDPQMALPKTQHTSAPNTQPPARGQRSSKPPLTWSGSLLTTGDLAITTRNNTMSPVDQTAIPSTSFSHDDVPDPRGTYSSYQTAQATSSYVHQPQPHKLAHPHASDAPSGNSNGYQKTQAKPSFSGQPPAYQPLRTQTNIEPAPTQASASQPLSSMVLRQVPDDSQQQQRKPAPSSSGAMSIDGESSPSKLNPIEQMLLAQWNPGLTFSSNGSKLKENLPFSSMEPSTSQRPLNNFATNELVSGSDPSARIVTSGMVSGNGLSKSRWA